LTVKKKLKWFLIISTSIGLLFVLFITSLFVYFSFDVYGEDELKHFSPETSLKIYDRHENLIGIFYMPDGKKTVVEYKDIPKKIIEAFISVEDNSFFEHSGIDYIGILRAVFIDVITLSKKQGASTITQQVAKNLLLHNKKTFTRKIKEMILAKRIEKILSKEEIMGLYVNNIYFGNTNYGIVEAAKYYFNKTLNDLNTGEIAYIAGLAKNPVGYALNKHPERAKERQRVVLKKMFERKVITEKEYKKYYDEPLKFNSESEKYLTSSYYFTNYVFQKLKDKYGEDFLFHNSVKVKTTLDANYQQKADESVKKELQQINIRQGILNPFRILKEDDDKEEQKLLKKENYCKTCVEGKVLEVNDANKYVLLEVFTEKGNEKGIVLKDSLKWVKKFNPFLYSTSIKNLNDIIDKEGVYIVYPTSKTTAISKGKFTVYEIYPIPKVQGALISLNVNTRDIISMIGGFDYELSQFNRATQAVRQPGSVFKPLIYALAIKFFHFSPSTIVYDTPEVFDDPSTKSKWKPQNFKKMSFSGTMTLKKALTLSVNMVAVKLFDKFVKEYGFKQFFEWIKKLGISTKFEESYAISLGSIGVKLLEITNAIAIFPSYGTYKTPNYLLSIKDNKNKEYFKDERLEERILSEAESYLMIDMMEEVVNSGTAQRASKMGTPVGGKTGTTNNNRNAWFVGYTKDVITGIWVGFDDMTPLGKDEQGGRTAVPMWVTFMQNVIKKDSEDFYVPEKIVFDYVNEETGLLVSSSDPNAVKFPFIDEYMPERQEEKKYVDTNDILMGNDDENDDNKENKEENKDIKKDEELKEKALDSEKEEESEEDKEKETEENKATEDKKENKTE